MDLTNTDIIAGAVAVANGLLEMEWTAGGHIESVEYSWYRIYNTQADECVAVLTGGVEDDPYLVPCDPHDAREFTRAMIKTLSFGEDTVDAMAWFNVLLEGSVEPKWLDKELLKATLEKGAAELRIDFDFHAWALRNGFSD